MMKLYLGFDKNQMIHLKNLLSTQTFAFTQDRLWFQFHMRDEGIIRGRITRGEGHYYDHATILFQLDQSKIASGPIEVEIMNEKISEAEAW